MDPYKKQFKCSAAYIFVFEILRRFIITRVQGFFSDHKIGKKGKIKRVVRDEYKIFFEPKREVFSRCTNFLVEAGLTNEKDQIFLEKCRRCRNNLAHHLDEVMLNQLIYWPQEKIDVTSNIQDIKEMRDILNKITLAWINKIETDNISSETTAIISPLVSFVDIGIASITE